MLFSAVSSAALPVLVFAHLLLVAGCSARPPAPAKAPAAPV
jgi:hypothetical protein